RPTGPGRAACRSSVRRRLRAVRAHLAGGCGLGVAIAVVPGDELLRALLKWVVRPRLVIAPRRLALQLGVHAGLGAAVGRVLRLLGEEPELGVQRGVHQAHKGTEATLLGYDGAGLA